MQKRAAVLAIVLFAGVSSSRAVLDASPDLAIELSSTSVAPSVTSGTVILSSGAVSEASSTARISLPTLPPPPAEVPLAPAQTEEQAPASMAEVSVGNVVGTVQSVDRNAHSLILQDANGRNVHVSLNKSTRFFRHGQQLDYRDIELNDVIAVRSSS